MLAVLSLAFLTVGAFLAGRRPANAVGWLLLGWGMVMAFVTLTSAYVDRATVRDPGSLPGSEWVALAEAMVWHPAFSLLAFLLLLFPHGRLPSPRWRPFAWFVVAVYLVLSLAAAVSPGAVTLYYPHLEGPVELGEERQQVKWFVYTVVTVVVLFVAGILVFGAGVLFPLFGLIPVAVAVAVFKPTRASIWLRSPGGAGGSV